MAPCKWILDGLGFQIPRNGFRISVLLSGSGFWITIVSGIPDSQRWIPDSKAHNSGFRKQNFLGIPDFTGKNFPHSGIRIPFHGASIKFGSWKGFASQPGQNHSKTTSYLNLKQPYPIHVGRMQRVESVSMWKYKLSTVAEGDFS